MDKFAKLSLAILVVSIIAIFSFLLATYSLCVLNALFKKQESISEHQSMKCVLNNAKFDSSTQVMIFDCKCEANVQILEEMRRKFTKDGAENSFFKQENIEVNGEKIIRVSFKLPYDDLKVKCGAFKRSIDEVQKADSSKSHEEIIFKRICEIAGDFSQKSLRSAEKKNPWLLNLNNVEEKSSSKKIG